MLYLDHLELVQFSVLIRGKRFKNLLISKVPQCLLGMILIILHVSHTSVCQADSEKAWIWYLWTFSFQEERKFTGENFCVTSEWSSSYCLTGQKKLAHIQRIELKGKELSLHFHCVYCITLPCLWIPCFLTKIIFLVISSSNQPTELSTKLLETDFKIDHFNRNISTLNCMLF